FNIIMQKLDSFIESFRKQHRSEYLSSEPERQKEINLEYKEELDKKILELGYTPRILDGKHFNYVEDRKLATELLEKLSPTIQSFKQAPHQSILIEIIEAATQGKS